MENQENIQVPVNDKTKFCKHCGAQIPEDAVICTTCGRQAEEMVKTKFCKHCGAKIPEDAVICTTCGRQVETIKEQTAQPNIVINNSNSNVNSNVNQNMAANRKAKNKWTALLLCIFLGVVGAHKFYEGKIGMGILYLFTGGLCGIGVLVDLIVILTKPNPYYI